MTRRERAIATARERELAFDAEREQAGLERLLNRLRADVREPIRHRRWPWLLAPVAVAFAIAIYVGTKSQTDAELAAPARHAEPSPMPSRKLALPDGSEV